MLASNVPCGNCNGAVRDVGKSVLIHPSIIRPKSDKNNWHQWQRLGQEIQHFLDVVEGRLKQVTIKQIKHVKHVKHHTSWA